MGYPMIFETKIVNLSDGRLIHFNRSGCNNDSEGRRPNDWRAKIYTKEAFKDRIESFKKGSKPYRDSKPQEWELKIHGRMAPPTIGTDIVLPGGYCFYLGGSVVTELEALKTYTVGVETRTITFDANGGTVTPASAETGTDGKLTELPTPSRSGYTFSGWFDAQTGGTEVTTDKEYTENTTIYAQWTKKSSSGGGGVTRYAVKFETNGGTTVSNKTVTRNSKLTEPTEPTRDGYTFDGWYTDKELTTAYDFDTKVTKAITLYAKWTENEVDNTDDKTDDKTDTPDTPVWENPFTDVKTDDWYYENVEYAVENGLFNGTTETTFAPNGIITRAMMVTVLYRAEGEPTVTGTATFEDVDSNAYYAKAVVWGQQNGIIKGYSETEFAPDQNITREQIAAIMHRYAQYKGYDVSVGENTNLLSYSDYDSISEYAIASMQYAVGSGLMKGKTNTTLNPLDNATRAEIAAILNRFIEANK